MTHTANQLIPEQGKSRRAIAAIWAFLQALESGPSGYTFDRIEALEREVRRLREEMREIRDAGPVDPQIGSAARLEH